MVNTLSSPISLRSVAAAAALALALGTASGALAQDESSSSKSSGSSSSASSGSSSDSASGEEGASSESGGEEEGKAEKEDGPDPDDPQYWAKVRKIRTVQKREFQKVNRFAATVYGGIIPNDIFARFYPVGLRLDYFILENIGVEIAGSRSFQSSTSLRGVLQEPEGVNASSVELADMQIWHTNIGILWSAAYGKAAWYENAIGYFDLYLFGGAGMVVTATEEFENQPDSELPRTIKPEGVLGAGLAWYIGDHLALRADFRQFLFQKVVGGVANPSEISVGAGWFF